MFNTFCKLFGKFFFIFLKTGVCQLFKQKKEISFVPTVWKPEINTCGKHFCTFLAIVDFVIDSNAHSAALKLYMGLIVLTISAVASMLRIISSMGLYAIGDSSMVALSTHVV